MKIFYFQQWLSVSYCWSMWSVPKRTISWLNWLRSKFFQSHNCRIWHWWKTCKSIIVNDQTIVCWIPYFNKARVCHIKSTNQYSISNSPPQCRSQQSCRRRNATLLHANVILLLLSPSKTHRCSCQNGSSSLISPGCSFSLTLRNCSSNPHVYFSLRWPHSSHATCRLPQNSMI